MSSLPELNSLANNPLFKESKPGIALTSMLLSFIDVGARGGTHEIVEPIAKFTSVLGFEPAEGECKRLMSMPEVVDPWAKIDLQPVALYDKDGDAELIIVNEATNTSLLAPNKMLTERYGMKKWQEVGRAKLKTTTLDKVIEKLGDNSIRHGEFIKLDTQGTEYEILQGATKTITENTVAVITEVSLCELYVGQKMFSEVEMLLREKGFSFYGFVSLHGRSKKLIDKTTHVTSERIIYANVVFFKDPLPLSESAVKLDERSIFSLFTCALLIGYYDFAYELALETWLKNSDNEEKDRIKKLIEQLSYISPADTKQEIDKIANNVDKHPEKANIIAGNFVDRRRRYCDYDDVLNISPLPKTQ